MNIPNKRVRSDVHHLYYYGALEVALGVIATLALYLSGWWLFYTCPVFVCFSGRGVTHIATGIARKKAIQQLGAPVTFSKSLEEIETQKAKAGMEGRLYIGEGFAWGPEHAQAYHEIANMPEKHLHFEQLGPDGGSPYIHNIGPYLRPSAEQPQFHVMPEHTGIIGVTGVGKTRQFEMLIAQLIHRNEPIIIIDPKSDRDLLNVTYQCCMAAGCTDRFEYFSLAHPQVSVFMNPFANFSTPGEIAGRITSIMPNSGNSQPFVDFCYDVLTGVAQVLILIKKEITIKSLYYYAVLNRKELLTEAKEFRNKNQLSKSHQEQINEAIEQLEVKIQHDPTHYQKMTTSLLPVLGSLSSGNIGAILNPTTSINVLSWKRIFEENLIVYMSLASMKDSYVSTNVGMLAVKDFVAFIGSEYTRRSKHSSKHLFIDEAATIVFEGWVDIANKCRAAGVHLYLGLQTTADIEAKISDPVSRQIFGLLTNKIYMRTLDPLLADELATSLGDCLVPKRTLTRNLAGTLKGPDIQSGELYKSGFSERLDLVETPLLPKPILNSLPRGQAILVTQGYPPIKLRLPLLRRDNLPEFSFFDHITKLYTEKEIQNIDALVERERAQASIIKV